VEFTKAKLEIVKGDRTAEDSLCLMSSGVGTAVAKWLRYCATNHKVAGSIPDLEFFVDMNPSDRTMALESTQPLTEMSTRSISWV
jgi:hypothetical protein